MGNFEILHRVDFEQCKYIHTVNSGSEMVEAKHVSGKNIYWSAFIDKNKEKTTTYYNNQVKS